MYLASLGLVGFIGKADRQGHQRCQVGGVQSQTSLQGCNCLKFNDDISQVVKLISAFDLE
jgi:hypothetical protein